MASGCETTCCGEAGTLDMVAVGGWDRGHGGCAGVGSELWRRCCFGDVRETDARVPMTEKKRRKCGECLARRETALIVLPIVLGVMFEESWKNHENPFIGAWLTWKTIEKEILYPGSDLP